VRRNDLVRIAGAREHLEILRSHLTRGDLDDAVVFDAVCLRLAAAIECVGAVDAAVRDDVFGTSWPAIASVRNRIAHSYVRVDREIIEATVISDLPGFEAQLDLLELRVVRES
jgi:uncharacterized protein with HEPN domain